MVKRSHNVGDHASVSSLIRDSYCSIIVSILTFLLASLSMFSLGRHQKINPTASLFCALAYSFCPHALGEAYNGNIEALSHGWLPLWFLFWLRTIDSPSRRNILFASLSLLGLLISNQYWAIAMFFAGLGTLPLMYPKSWLHRAKSLLAILLPLLCFIPIAQSIWTSLHARKRLNDVTSDSVPMQPPYISDLKEVFVPLNQEIAMTPFQDIVYVGIGIMFFAFFSVFRKPKHYTPWLFFVLGWFYFILMLGPVLYLDGNIQYNTSGKPFYLPWYYIFQNIDGLKWMTLPHRMAIPATLFLTLSVGVCIQNLKWEKFLYVILLCEIWLYPPFQIPLTYTELPKSEHSRILKGLPMGGVLNLPVNLYSNKQRKYLWFQSIHKKPIADHFRYSMFSQVSKQSLFIEASRAIEVAPLPSETKPDPLQIEALKEAGYRYIVVHKEFVLEQQKITSTEYAQWLNLHIGEGVILKESYLYPLDKSHLPTLLETNVSTYSLGLPSNK